MTDTLTPGLFAADTASRTLRGLLVRHGEMSRRSVSGTEPISFARGTIALPRDPSVVSLNRQHDRFDPVGRATVLEDREDGVYAEFAIADTEEGDAYLADPSSLRKLSAELAGIVRQGARGVRARLTGAALVTEGAFASSALFALDDITEAEAGEAVIFEPVDGRIEVAATEAPAVVAVTVDGSTTEYTAETPETAETETAEMAAATAPETATTTEPREEVGLPGLFALITAAQSNDRAAIETLNREHTGGALFALQDVRYDATNAGGSIGNATRQPAYVGELWAGRGYQQKVVPLLGSGTLRALKNQGFRFTTKPTVDAWAGNKAEIPTSNAATELYTYTAQRFAGGWDIAREYIDFGETAIIDAFLRHAVDDYARKVDAKALADIQAASAKVVAKAAPTGVNAGLAKIIQGALQVIAADASPSFALVAPDVFESIAYTREQDRLAFIGTALGLEEGQTAGFRVVPFSGLTAGHVLVGAKEAATVEQLGATPIRVSALDIARGGVDEALFGYAATRIDLPAALVNVTPAA